MNDSPSSLNRRKFLATSAGAGLVLGAPNILRAAESGDSSDKIHVGLIGVGKEGNVLLNAMMNIPGLHFQAVCDIWDYARKRAMAKIRRFQGQMPAGYMDTDEMLANEKGLDAVVIAVPDFWHSPLTVKCLKAGLDVYCEKMMSNTIDGARAMVKAMEETGKLCQIGHQRRSNPRYRYTLDQLIHGNRICGQIVDVNGQWNRAVKSSQELSFSKKIALKPEILQKYGFKDMEHFMNWRLYRDLSGGPISDLGAHQIDVFNWYLGTRPKRVYASGGNDYFRNREQFDNVMVIFDYDTIQAGKPCGVRAFYQVLTTTSAGGGYYESFMGVDGTINISERAAFTNIFRESSAPSWDDLVNRGYLKHKAAPTPPAGGNSDAGAVKVYESEAPELFDLPGGISKPPHQPHLENFFAAVRDGGKTKLNCDAREAFLSEAPIYYVNPSARACEPIVFTPEQLSV